MLNLLPEWARPTTKGVIENVIANAILAVIVVCLSAVLTRLANPASDADAVRFFLGTLLVLSVAWALLVFGWRRLHPVASVTIPLERWATTLASLSERDRLELYVIACLSTRVEPSMEAANAVSGKPNVRLRFLEDAIRDGRLIASRGDVAKAGPEDGLMVQVKHSDLKAFAEQERHPDLIRFTQEWAPKASTTNAQSTPPTRDAVDFVIKGHWLNTLFQCASLGPNEAGEPIYSEDIYLTVIANSFLENVTLSVAVRGPNSPDDIREYRHGGKINGTVTPGMQETIRIYRRTFRLAACSIEFQDGSGDKSARLRRDVQAVFFDGTSAELKTQVNDLQTVEARLHHKGGSVVARFVLDTRVIAAPRSRIVLGGGPIRADIPNNFMNALGFPTGDEGML
jgi:hypothetical protein